MLFTTAKVYVIKMFVNIFKSKYLLGLIDEFEEVLKKINCYSNVFMCISFYIYKNINTFFFIRIHNAYCIPKQFLH